MVEQKKTGIFGSIFPREYDFRGMLEDQAENTLAGVGTLVFWLKDVPLKDPVHIDRKAIEVDELRHKLEEKLTEAFSTPFDRQDMYTLSRHMDYILNFTRETAREMFSFGVEPDEPIIAMADALYRGTSAMENAVKSMDREKTGVEGHIRDARKSMHDIEEIYIESMAELLRTEDAMNALRKREIYHHLRDAGRALRRTVDLLHKAFVGMN